MPGATAAMIRPMSPSCWSMPSRSSPNVTHRIVHAVGVWPTCADEALTVGVPDVRCQARRRQSMVGGSSARANAGGNAIMALNADVRRVVTTIDSKDKAVVLLDGVNPHKKVRPQA